MQPLYYNKFMTKDIKLQSPDNEQIKKIIKELRPMDDAFMRILLRDSIPLAEHVLRIILGNDDLVITDIETQRDLKNWRADGRFA